MANSVLQASRLPSNVVLITGGSRSGKSAYAQRAAEALSGLRAFIATCPVFDDEMRQRVARHQAERAGKGWRTLEEQLDLSGALLKCGDCSVVLVDCLTLWVNNLMHYSPEITEDDIERASRGILDACRKRPGTVFLVTNEVGMGIVPENPLARRFRDLAGRCNQTIAAGADKVVLLVAGQPLVLKPAVNLKLET